MRVQWIVSILSILVCIGLLVIIMRQDQVSIMLKKEGENLQMKSERLDGQYINEDSFKATIERLLVQGSKIVADLEVTLGKLRTEMKEKETENDACQAEKKTKADELAGVEKEHTETEAMLKAESDAWNQEINTLKAQLTGYRPICDYVKKDPLSVQLCGNETSGTSLLKKMKE